MEERIEKYLNGELSDSEAAAFEMELRKDPDLAAEVELQNTAQSAVEFYGEKQLRTKMRTWQTPSTRRKKWPIYMAAAVLLGVCIGIIPFLNNNSQKTGEQFFTEYFEPYRAPISVRGNDGANLIYQDARKAYVNQDFEKSQVLFEEVIGFGKVTAEYEDALFYAGISALAATPPKANDAQRLLKKSSEIPNTLQQQSLWYLGLAYLQNEEYSKAIHTFQKTNFKPIETKQLLESLTKKESQNQ